MARHRGNWHGHHGNSQPPTPTPPEDSPLPETTPSPETSNAPNFADLGATFNDATRALVGGLWQNTVEEGGQGLGSVYRYINDLNTVQSGIQAEIDAGSFGGTTLQHAQDILNSIETAISAAIASVNGGGSFGSVAAAETALHDSHLNVLTIVNADSRLSVLATANGANGFLAAPAALPDGFTAATAPHDNLADIGAIFNDLANRSLGGINADNKAIVTEDVNALITDMQGLMTNNPLLFGGLTGVHAEAVVRQLQLELQYINQAGVSPDAGRASNDNILDIIDIIQGDTNLANMASQGGVTGFTAFGDALNPTPKYLDNDAQTNFWANFIAQSNSLGQEAVQIVGNGDNAMTAALTAELQTFQKSVTDFDAAQGGIFEARFDNELLGSTSTLGAEVSKMIEGLQSGNAALVAAAADQMHANAADVGGNNLPNTGGTYNPDGLTVAEVLPQASTAAVAAAEPAVTAATQVAAAVTASTTASSAIPDSASTPAASDVAAPTTTAVASAAGAAHPEHFPHHFEHYWG
jgi:hypothetical protein